MTDYTDLIARLRDLRNEDPADPQLGKEAADAIAARLIAAYIEGYRPQDWPKEE